MTYSQRIATPIEYLVVRSAREPSPLKWDPDRMVRATYATFDCPYCDPPCGQTVELRVDGDRRHLPKTVSAILRVDVHRDCPVHLARKRAAQAERQRRWRAANPALARERNREQVAAHRARRKAEAAAKAAADYAEVVDLFGHIPTVMAMMRKPEEAQ